MRASLVLITAFLAFANTAAAGTVDWEAARQSGMPKLTESAVPNGGGHAVFTDASGEEKTLADWKGKVVLVNFWATWCFPCREEMPSLDRLQAEMGGEDFEVLTIASGRNPIADIEKFFDETGIEHLPILRDEKQLLAREMGVAALPISVLIDRDGFEVARVIGDEDWSSDAAKSVIAQLTAP